MNDQLSPSADPGVMSTHNDLVGGGTLTTPEKALSVDKSVIPGASMAREEEDHERSSNHPKRKEIHTDSVSPTTVTEIGAPTQGRSTRGSKRRKTQENTSTIAADPAMICTPVTEKKRKLKTEAVDEDMAWICGECNEAECLLTSMPHADKFLICDGPCQQRVFHYPCVGETTIPDENKPWYCKDCASKRHRCAFCQEYGQDDVDVFPCSKAESKKCGLFFHESCLEMHGVEVTRADAGKSGEIGAAPTSPGPMEGDEEASPSTLYRPIFTCPAHTCWTCTQNDAKERERQEAKEQATGKRGGKKRSKKKSIFQCKTEGRLFRCLHCPWAFHASCLPPMARFHELAVLCHEHSATHKLPDLDLSSSLQGSLEDKLDQKTNRRKSRKLLKGANPFFPGIRGDQLNSSETELLEHIQTKQGDQETVTQLKNVMESGFGNDGELPFCLPADIKDAVYSKPTSYSHVNALKYDPENKPKKALPGTEKCTCVKKCGDDCFNRQLLIECQGDGKSSNCNVGGADCGNRELGKRQFVKCKPKRERGKGWGLVSVQAIPKGKLVQEYVGEVIDEEEKEKRLIQWSKDHPNDPNFYVMALSGGWYIDARDLANMSRFINHCCEPNCSLVAVNVKGFKRCGIYAKRPIAAGEFLSYDYHFDTKHADYFACRCGAAKCRGTMMGGRTKGGGVKSPMNWKEAKTKYDQDEQFLKDRKRESVISQVDVLIPAAELETDLVSAGPLHKHKSTMQTNGICLWRNARRGADFVARASRLESRHKTKTAREGLRKTTEKQKAPQHVDVLSILRQSH